MYQIALLEALKLSDLSCSSSGTQTLHFTEIEIIIIEYYPMSNYDK